MNEAPIPFVAYLLIGIATNAALPIIGGRKSKTRKNKH